MDRGNTLNVTADALGGAKAEAPATLPIEQMNTTISRIVKKWATVFDMPIDFATSSAYAAVAAALGGRITVKDPKGHINTAAIWTVHVASSGTGKTPMEDEAVRPFVTLQDKYDKEYNEELLKWEREGKNGKAPTAKSVIEGDATIEALVNTMKANNGQVFQFIDEIKGWVECFDNYETKGTVQKFLSMWSGKWVKLNRITRKMDFVRETCLNVFGGIQSEELASSFGQKTLMNNGFNHRICWVFPKVGTIPPYRVVGIDDSERKLYEKYITTLLGLPPKELRFSSGAVSLYAKYCDRTSEKIMRLDKEAAMDKKASYMKNMLSKLKIIVEKWALITHILSFEMLLGDDVSEEIRRNNFFKKISVEIDDYSMRAAIDAMSLFEQWAEKVYDTITLPRKQHSMTSEQAIREIFKLYPDLNRTKFAESIGVSQPYVSKCINKGM